MRNRYGRALYGLTAVMAVGAMIGLAVTGASAATNTVKPKVTPSCEFDSYCSDPIFNVEFGIQYFQNNSNLRWVVGNPVNLNYANDNNPGEDWKVDLQESVSYLYSLGFVSAAIDNKYNNYEAAEVQWVPYGVTSDLCRGLAKPAKQGEAVTLQPCGNFPETLWIVGKSYSYYGGSHVNRADDGSLYGGNTLISAASSNPSIPYVLTAGGGVWGGNPTANLQVDMQASDDGVINPGQLWCTASVTYQSYGGPEYSDPSPTPSYSSSDPPPGNHHSPPVTPPTIGPPTYTANSPCFPDQHFNYYGH
jgi:hypothetical protein